MEESHEAHDAATMMSHISNNDTHINFCTIQPIMVYHIKFGIHVAINHDKFY